MDGGIEGWMLGRQAVDSVCGGGARETLERPRGCRGMGGEIEEEVVEEKEEKKKSSRPES